MLLFAGLLGAACQRPAAKPEPDGAAQPNPAPAPASAPASDAALAELLAPVERLAAGDLDGDGVAELVLVDAEHLRVVELDGRERARVPVFGGLDVLRVDDLDGDGRPELLTGWGRSRAHPQAPARAGLWRLDGDALVEDLVIEEAGERPEIVALLPVAAAPGRLLVARFVSKYMVELAHADRGAGGWTLSPIETIRMATSVALGDLDGDGGEDLILGRVYGEGPDGEGDAFLRRPDGARVAIPIVGGVRSLAVVDLDGDGRDELLIGDGWNRDYGRVARARLTHARWDGGGFVAELLDEGAGQFTLWDVQAVDLDGDGQAEIVTRGNAGVRLLERRGASWRTRQLAAGCEDVRALELAGVVALLLACGEHSRVVRGD